MVDIEKIRKAVNSRAKEILTDIAFKYEFTDENKEVISSLLNSGDIVIVDEYSDDLLKHFSGNDIQNKDMALEKVPGGTGGRCFGDGKIHMITFSPVFKDKSDDEMINIFINHMLVHEIFHYFIQLDKNISENSNYEKISHFLTEGFVQMFALEYSLDNGLVEPVSDYDRNVQFASILRKSTKGYSDLEYAEELFKSNVRDVLDKSSLGIKVFELYEKTEYIHDEMISFLEDLFRITKDFSKKEEIKTQSVIRSAKRNYDLINLYPVMVEQFYKYMLGIEEEKEKDTSKSSIDSINNIYNLFVDRLNAMKPYVEEATNLHNEVLDKYNNLDNSKKL